MPGDDLFLTLLWPLGPSVDFGEYQAYQDRVILEMDLATVLAGMGRDPQEYGRWLEDVAWVGLAYAEAHPQHGQAVRRALLEIGLDPWDGEETP